MTVAIKSFLFTLIVVGGLTVLMPYLLIVNAKARFSSELSNRILGISLITFGAALYAICTWDFALTGKGTPAVWDPPKKFVFKGLYRFVRNPMYIGILLILTGEAIAFQSLTLLAVSAGLALIFHMFVVLYEELHLRKIFGESYQEYCRSVNRWMPRMPSSRARK